jgi:hypothetical protein
MIIQWHQHLEQATEVRGIVPIQANWRRIDAAFCGLAGRLRYLQKVSKPFGAFEEDPGGFEKYALNLRIDCFSRPSGESLS